MNIEYEENKPVQIPASIDYIELYMSDGAQVVYKDVINI